jgi:hypothetical protein
MSSSEFIGLDYKLEEAIWTLMLQREAKPLHVAFARHLGLVREALEAIDRVLDSAEREGSEDAAIKACLGEHWKELTLQAALEQIGEIQDKLMELMK